jgi:CRISPR system Cascade subunit CasE
MARQRIKDAYSIHRTVYGLFEQVRGIGTEKDLSSGILYADRGMKKGWREIIIVSNRSPQPPPYGKLEAPRAIPENLYGFSSYRFKITINPVKREKSSGKLVPIRTREAVAEWFAAKAPKWGFEPTGLEVKSLDVVQFDKKNQRVTLGQATRTGQLKVIDAGRFANSFKQGIGRGKAFGCGLLQIVPIS